jgi:hypothetical protein
MKVTPSTAQVLTLDASHGLDPIRVIFMDEKRLGAGRVIVQCWDRSWCSFWGAMGERTVREFFLSCDSHYLTDNLIRGTEPRMLAKLRKHEIDYVRRIVEAIQVGLRQQDTLELVSACA